MQPPRYAGQGGPQLLERGFPGGCSEECGGQRGNGARSYPLWAAQQHPLRTAAARVEAEGLAGDRRKKQPVHIVGAEETPETTRANVFVTAPSAELTELLGRQLRLGGATLLVTQIPTGCVGIYAGVVEAGDVGIGDVLDPQDPASTSA